MKSNTKNMSIYDTKNIARIGLLIALSAIGAMIKMQGTIAFDSMPGYFAALFISPTAGAFVAILGHILTSFTSGFPLTLPMHLIIALEMGLFALIFGWMGKKGTGILATIVAAILNGPVATLMAAYTAKLLGLPFNGMTMFNALVIPLTIASTANIVLALVIYKIMKRQKR